MALPVIPREGGLMLALPADYLAEDAITDASLGLDEEALLGPSREFTAALIGEDEDGNEVGVGVRETFLIVDVADLGLPMMRGYDAVNDPVANDEPFSRGHPVAIVKIADVMPLVQEWVTALSGAARLKFYSAREEPELAKASPKRAAAPKRLTTAALAERVDLLSAQLQSLIELQSGQGAVPKHPGYATHVPGPAAGAIMPATPVSAGLGTANAADVGKAAALVGPPPKMKPPQNPLALSQEEVLAKMGLSNPGQEVDPSNPNAASVSMALMQQSSAITALVAHLASDGVDLGGPAVQQLAFLQEALQSERSFKRIWQRGPVRFFFKSNSRCIAECIQGSQCLVRKPS